MIILMPRAQKYNW